MVSLKISTWEQFHVNGALCKKEITKVTSDEDFNFGMDNLAQISSLKQIIAKNKVLSEHFLSLFNLHLSITVPFYFPNYL